MSHMKRNKLAETAAATAERLGTNAAWGELIHEHPDHATTLENVAAGGADTNALPVELALAAVALLDPADLGARTGNDPRGRITAAASRRRTDRVDGRPLSTVISELAAAEPAEAPALLRRLGTNDWTAIFDHLAVHGFGDTTHQATPTEAVAAILHTEPNWMTVAAPTRHTDLGARARITAAFLHTGEPTTWEGIPFDELRATITVLEALAADDNHLARHGDTLRDALAIAAALLACHGADIDEVARTVRVANLAEADDDTVKLWFEVWAEQLEPQNSAPYLTAVTGNGTRTRTGYIPVAFDQAHLSAPVAFALREYDPDDTARAIATWLTNPACTWTIDEITEQLDADPAYAAMIHVALHNSPDPRLHPAIAEANMRTLGLAAWVTSPSTDTAARLAAAAAAERFGPAEWALVHKHLETFYGTPEELIGMLAPACT